LGRNKQSTYKEPSRDFLAELQLFLFQNLIHTPCEIPSFATTFAPSQDKQVELLKD